MPKRMVLLSDEEIDLVLAWAEVVQSIQNVPVLPDELVLHDFEEDDEAVLGTLRRARLAA